MPDLPPLTVAACKQAVSPFRRLTGFEYNPDVLRNLTYPKVNDEVRQLLSAAGCSACTV